MTDKAKTKHLIVHLADFSYLLCNDEPRYHLQKGKSTVHYYGRYQHENREQEVNILKHNTNYDFHEEDPKLITCDKCLMLLESGLEKGYFKVKKLKSYVSVKLDLSLDKRWENAVFRFKTPQSQYDKLIIYLAERLKEDPTVETWQSRGNMLGAATSPQADMYLAAYLNFSYMFDEIRTNLVRGFNK